MKLLLGDGGCAVIEFTSLMLKIYTARAKNLQHSCSKTLQHACFACKYCKEQN